MKMMDQVLFTNFINVLEAKTDICIFVIDNEKEEPVFNRKCKVFKLYDAENMQDFIGYVIEDFSIDFDGIRIIIKYNKF